MKHNKGFSLIEVLVALAILAGGIIIVSSSWSGNFLRVRKSTLYNNVSVLLERKMTEIDALYRGKSIDEIPDEDSGDFGSDFPEYRWTLNSQPFEMPDLSANLTSQKGGADDTLIQVLKQMKEFMSESVVEAKVTVFVKGRSKEIKFSATTYFVDYSKDFSMGGAGGE